MITLRQRIALCLQRIAGAVLAFFTVGSIKLVRLIDVDVMSNLAGNLLQRIGPWLPEHRIGRANLAAAFPEKSAAEIEGILRGAWNNLGRVAAEFAHIGRLWDDVLPDSGGRRVDAAEKDWAKAVRLRDDGKPALIFSAHLANWELAAVCATRNGIDTVVLYRPPNVKAVSDAVIRLRAGCMGTLVPTGLDAPAKLAEALARGSHVAMLVDQYYGRGVPVTFFGRPTLANPFIARLARHFDCAIHGTRVIRRPGNRFIMELTDEIAPARDAEGKIDVVGTMQIITDVVEGWVREYPEQWLWLHRRWRDNELGR